MARAGALEGAALPSQTVHHIRWLGLRHAVTRGGLCPNSTALRSLRRFESFCLRSRVSPAKAAPTTESWLYSPNCRQGQFSETQKTRLSYIVPVPRT